MLKGKNRNYLQRKKWLRMVLPIFTITNNYGTIIFIKDLRGLNKGLE